MESLSFNGGEGKRSKRERTRIYLEVKFKGKYVIACLVKTE